MTAVKLCALVAGGGQITDEVILPVLAQEKQSGNISEIRLCARSSSTALRMKKKHRLGRAYPESGNDPLAYKRAIRELPPGSACIVAVPDHLHAQVVAECMINGIHAVVEKPLCLKTSDSAAILRVSHKKGIYVLTDFHKRHDLAVRAAKYRYETGCLGKLLHGHAWIEEKKSQPLKTFRKWCEKSSPFDYIGVHYADAYHFITGLNPKKVVAFGQKKFLKEKGIDAFDSVQAVIEWADGSVFFIQSAWVCSEKNSALTNQGMQLLGTKGEYWSDHKDRNTHFVTDANGYEDYNPYFFKPYPDWNGAGKTEWLGYGRDGLRQGLNDIRKILAETSGFPEKQALKLRRKLLETFEKTRCLPGQASVSVSIAEAVRKSISLGGKPVYI